MKSFVKKITWLQPGTTGWGNGYVVIPKGHKLHGINYDDINVNVHGGLTFSKLASDLDWIEIPEDAKDGWIVGFDTAHYGDNISRWTKSAVEEETERLRQQLMHYKKRVKKTH